MFCFFLACNSSPEEERGDTSRDTVLTAAAPEEKAELDQIVEQYVRGYKDTVRLDTIIFHDNKKYAISFMHYCLYDNGVTVPEKYVAVYGMKEFKTHNFQSKLTIRSDDRLLADETIDKETFSKSVTVDLHRPAVLLYPNFSFEKDLFSVSYSLSIPLTDVGTRTEFAYRRDGTTSIRASYP